MRLTQASEKLSKNQSTITYSRDNTFKFASYSSTKLKLTDNNVILLKTHKIEPLSVLL